MYDYYLFVRSSFFFCKYPPRGSCEVRYVAITELDKALFTNMAVSISQSDNPPPTVFAHIPDR